jgi:hypothetical protein
MVFELDENEKEIVKHALEVFEKELWEKRVKTDRREWKAAIHDEEDAVKRILRKVA